MGTLFPNLRGKTLTRAMEEKSIAFSRYYQDLAVRNLHLRGGQSWPIERAIAEGYERVIWVFKSVNVTATDSSGLPFRLRENGQVLDDHPLYRVLNKRANPLESGQVFRKRLSAQVMLSPRGSFVQRVRSNRGTVKEFHLLPPDRTEIIPGIYKSGFEAQIGDTKNTLIDHIRLTRQDGTVKNLEPDEVLWFRDPHPTDPYAAVTPLAAAGMSVELDHFARLYNVSFMQNDGRPGGVLAVRSTDGTTGDIDPAAMDRVEKRFGKGPVEAGKLSVIAGELSYVDLATRPRDMQYGQTSANSKVELLAAFGMSEVVLGNAAGRTFDNADAEMYNYWTRTIPAHNRILIDGFDEDSEDSLEGFFDTSEVEVLERAAKARRDEARTEVKDGLRSPKSYADLAGYGDEIEDNIYTRSLYAPNGKTPLPTRPGDGVLLGLDTGAEAAAPAGGPEAVAGAPGVDMGALGAGGAPAALNAPATPGVDADAAGAPAAPGVVEGVDMAALAGAKGLRAIEGGGDRRPKVRFAYSLSAKDAAWEVDEQGEVAQQRLERELAATLSALSERLVERAAVRAASPRQRKGTRHFVPEYDRDTRVGHKALDAAKAVDEETWQQEAEEQTHPLVTAAAVAAAVALLTGMDATPPGGETLQEWAGRLVREIVRDTVRLIGRSAARQARLLVAYVNRLDQEGESIDGIVDAVRAHRRKVDDWAAGVSVQAATGTIGGARDAAAQAVEDDDQREVQREWISKRDDVVRDSHRVADGQVRGMRQPFIVGGHLLRFPCDPLAPIQEIANCRCRVRYRSRRTGRFVNMTEPLAVAGAS